MNLTRILSITAFSLTINSCSTSPEIDKLETLNIDMSSASFTATESDVGEQTESRMPYSVQIRADAIEDLLNRDEKTLSCPGLKLVVSCGNTKCEAEKGETISSCAADCVPAPIVSYNNQTRCTEFKSVYKPSNELELQAIVKEATSKGQHIKVIGNSHSANQILCSDGIAIVTEKMNHALGLETFEGEQTVKVESGMLIWDLNEWLFERGLGIGYSIMGFRGVTIGGAIATGSHGSSVKHNSVISNIVQSITLVDAQGSLREFSKGSSDANTWKALTTSFGLLGIVTQVRLKVQPAQNLDMKVSFHHEKELFKSKDGVFAPVKNCDFGVMNWFPGTRKFMKVCGNVTVKKPDAGATNNLLNPPLPPKLVNVAKQVLQLGACSNATGCLVESLRYSMMKFAPPIQKFNSKGKLVATRNAVGPTHRMVSSFLTDYQKGFFQMDWEIAVPKSRANEAMKAVLAHIRKNKICLPLVGVFLRFTPSMDETLMAHTTSYKDFIKGEPVVYIEMPVYLPVGFTPEMKQKYDAVFEDFAKLLINHYGARAHWGKNRDWVFAMQRDQDVYGENLKKFQSVVDDLDPHGVFSNKFAESIGIKYH